MDTLYPKELDTEEVAYYTVEPKIKEAIDQFNAGTPPKIMAFINSRMASKRPLRITLECEALGDVIVGDYGQTVLCRVLDQEDIDGLSRLDEQAVSLIPDEISFKPLLKDDKFFLKLAVKDDRYKFDINPDYKPSQLEKSPFHQSSTVSIECQPNIWINFETAQAGIFLNVAKVVVDGGKKKVLRKR